VRFTGIRAWAPRPVGSFFAARYRPFKATVKLLPDCRGHNCQIRQGKCKNGAL
jgi:hypothetical protein